MDRRHLLASGLTLAAGALLPAAGGCAQAPADPVFRPEDFGAAGDGRTNDTRAFQRLATAVNAAGGGRIVLRPVTYLVGQQRAGGPGEPYAFAPEHILRLARCSRPLTIEGNKARLRCAPGLRYGTFDRRSGARIDRKLPYTVPGDLATPYDYMVLIESCTAPIVVQDLELDGGVAGLRIGGPWGDTGWQIAAVGLFLRENTGGETVRGVHSHHHAQDGIILAGASRAARGVARAFSDVRCDANGRQGMSIIGGRGYRFTDCRFTRTGRGPVSSAPGAGMDIEAEVGTIRDLAFVRCEFSDNAGCGMVADSGDSANVRFDACRFVGTTNWSAWPNKPGFVFTGCEFVGAVVRCFSSDAPGQATRFMHCRFTDDPARASRGRVYLNGPMVNLSDSRNVLFQSCTFTATHGAQLPWSTAVIFADCVMRQSGPVQAYPRGTFRGTNRIDGNVDIGASRVIGRLLLNGQIVPPR